MCEHKRPKLLFVQVYLRERSTILLSLLIIAKGDDDDVAVMPNSTLLCQLKSARSPCLHSSIFVYVCVSLFTFFVLTIDFFESTRLTSFYTECDLKM